MNTIHLDGIYCPYHDSDNVITAMKGDYELIDETSDTITVIIYGTDADTGERVGDEYTFYRDPFTLDDNNNE